MKLFGLIVNSGTIGKDADSWTEEEVNGQPILLFADSASQAYEDITNIERISLYWPQTNRDFLVAKAVAKEYFDTFGQSDTERFNALDSDEKNAACDFKLGTNDDMIAFLGITVFTEKMIKHHKFSEEARRIRMDHALTEVEIRLPDNFKDFMNDVLVDKLVERYVVFGNYGTIEGLQEGILDYILARAGTTYAVSGFKLKQWTPIQTDMVLLSNKMTDILRDGIY